MIIESGVTVTGMSAFTNQNSIQCIKEKVKPTDFHTYNETDKEIHTCHPIKSINGTS